MRAESIAPPLCLIPMQRLESLLSLVSVGVGRPDPGRLDNDKTLAVPPPELVGQDV